MTAIGVLMQQLTGQGRAQHVRGGMALLRSNASVNWRDPGPWSLYRWYYITQAMFQNGGAAWTQWNHQFALAFVHNQNRDGSWTSPSQGQAGGGREVNYDPVYATAIAALSLQVYYRLLPTFAVVEDETRDDVDAHSGDVVISII